MCQLRFLLRSETKLALSSSSSLGCRSSLRTFAIERGTQTLICNTCFLKNAVTARLKKQSKNERETRSSLTHPQKQHFRDWWIGSTAESKTPSRIFGEYAVTYHCLDFNRTFSVAGLPRAKYSIAK